MEFTLSLLTLMFLIKCLVAATAVAANGVGSMVCVHAPRCMYDMHPVNAMNNFRENF